MKKVIALALCMLLLLSGCGYLDGAPGGAVEMKELFITAADENLDLRNLSIRLEAARSDAAYGLRLTVSDGGEVKDELIAATVEDSLLLLLNNSAGDSRAYVTDDPRIMEPLREMLDGMEAAEGSLADEDVDLETMTDEELDEYMAQLEEQLQAMGLDGEGLSEQDQQAMDETIAQAERMAEILSQCVTEGEPQQFDGETYATQNIDLPNDMLVELLGMLDTDLFPGGEMDLAQALIESGITVDLTGVIATSEDGGKSAYGFTPVITDETGESLTLNITLQHISDDGSVDFYFDISENGQDVGSLSVVFDAFPVDEADWLPDAVSADAQPLDLDDEAASETLTEALENFFDQVGVTIANMMLGSGAAGSLN